MLPSGLRSAGRKLRIVRRAGLGTHLRLRVLMPSVLLRRHLPARFVSTVRWMLVHVFPMELGYRRVG